jgi:hypothetical protein
VLKEAANSSIPKLKKPNVMNRLHRWGLLSLLLTTTLTACYDEQDLIPSTPGSNSYTCAESAAEQERYLPVSWDAAPAYVRNYVADNYPGLQPALVILDETDADDYEVYVLSQSGWISLHFDDGRWERTEQQGSLLALLPNEIVNCINDRFPGASIEHFYTDWEGDVEVYILFQGFIFELDFDRIGGGAWPGGSDTTGNLSCLFEEEGHYQPVAFTSLPAGIRQYLTANYPALTPALILKELDEQEWEVYLKDNQRWRSLEFEGNNVVSNRLEGHYLPQTPLSLAACIQQAFPSASPQLVYRENDGDYTAYLLINGLIREVSWID